MRAYADQCFASGNPFVRDRNEGQFDVLSAVRREARVERCDPVEFASKLTRLR